MCNNKCSCRHKCTCQPTNPSNRSIIIPVAGSSAYGEWLSYNPDLDPNLNPESPWTEQYWLENYVKGPKGDKGDPGEKGEKGDPGSGGSGIIFASTPSEETSTNFNDAFPSVSRGSMIIDESKLSVFIKISDTTWSKIPVQILPDEVSELVIQSAYIQSFK